MPISQHDFGATNERDTCLWCGEKLAHETMPVETIVRADGLIRTFSTGRENMFKQKGVHGDGFFCTLGCGFQYAVAMAKNGQRLQPKE